VFSKLKVKHIFLTILSSNFIAMFLFLIFNNLLIFWMLVWVKKKQNLIPKPLLSLCWPVVADLELAPVTKPLFPVGQLLQMDWWVVANEVEWGTATGAREQSAGLLIAKYFVKSEIFLIFHKI
jgi:hypothetical protein